MSLTWHTEVDWKGAPEIERALNRIASETAHDLKAETQRQIEEMGAVDSGFLKNSVMATPLTRTLYIVWVLAHYAQPVHDGYHQFVYGRPSHKDYGGDEPGHKPPRPFFKAAIDIIRPQMIAKLRALGFRLL